VEHHLVKLAGDGRIRREFHPIRVHWVPHGGASPISAIVADKEGGCFVGGTFIDLNGESAFGLAHVSASGDVSPINRPELLRNESPVALERVEDRLLVVQDSHLYFIDPDGSVQQLLLPPEYSHIRFGGAVYREASGIAVSAAFMRDGNYDERVFLFDQNGTLDSAFTSELSFGAWPLRQLGWDQSGGLFGLSAKVTDTSPAQSADGQLWGPKRLLANGALDPRWSRTLHFNAVQSDWCQLTNGDLVVSGGFTSVSGHPISQFVKLRGDGAPPLPRTIQQSARGRVAHGESHLIMGLVIPASNWTQDALIRGVSGSLGEFGVTHVVSGVNFTLFQQDTPLIQVDAGQSQSLERFFATQVGAFPLPFGHNEAQKLVSLKPGVYTVVFSSTTGSGELLGEVYFW
jgi:hypothetical protein